MPKKAINPPQKAVVRIPNLSTKILDTADKKKVVPIAEEPIKDALVAASGSSPKLSLR